MLTQKPPRRRYFDWAATAPPAAAEGIAAPAEAPFGNPSSPHREGALAREALEGARARCAAALGVPPGGIVFTSGGTEANALVIMAQALRPGRASTLYAASEHPSVRENCLLLQRLGRPVRALPVSPEGMLDRERLEDALTKKDDGHAAPRFLAVMAVNNETGVINEIPAIARLVRERASAPVHIHCDIVQAAGKVPITLSEWDVDSAALSAHKLGGPRGIGLLYLRKPLEPLYRGGGQEKGLRPGTENTAGALALAAVLEARVKNLRDADARARERFRHLISELKKMPRCALIPSCRAADDARFSPWILQAAFSGAPGEVLTRSLDEAGFAVSTGSACSSRSPERPVLEAMGVSEARRLEGIRISQGWTTTREDIDALLEALREALAFL